MCMKYRYLLPFVAAIILLVYSCEVDASRTRTGSRRRAVSTSRRRSSSKGSGSSGAKPPKIYPYTPMNVRTYGSPIIRKQARSRSSFNRVLIGSAATYFVLSRAPMYHGHYPMFYRSYVRIPDNRAVRVWKEETRVTDSYGETCFNTVRVSGYNYTSSNDNYLNKSRITVDYGNSNNTGSENVTLDASRSGDNVTITSVNDYSKPIIPGTNCTRVTVTTTVTLIEMYETNPNGSGGVQGSVAAAFLLPLLLELMRRWR